MSDSPDAKLLRRIDRLDAATERLLDEMSLAEERTLRRPPVSGAWTPLETLRHLNLSERQSVDYLSHKLEQRAVMPRLGVRDWIAGKAVSLALASPLKFKAPPAIDAARADVSSPAHLQTLADEARATRSDLREVVGRVPEEWRGRAVFRHPTAGRMSLVDMLRLFAVHQRRHAKQIRRALAQNARYYRRQEAG